MTSYYDSTSSPGDYWPLLCNGSNSNSNSKSETSKRESEGVSALPSTCELLASITVLTNDKVREPEMTKIRPDGAEHRYRYRAGFLLSLRPAGLHDDDH